MNTPMAAAREPPLAQRAPRTQSPARDSAPALGPAGIPVVLPPGAPPDEPTGNPWYAAGLRFTCTQCGNCCSGAPGYVWLTHADMTVIAAHLALSREEFTRRHTRSVGPRHSLNELRNGDCEFLRRTPAGRALCSVYEVRPRQCRTWPFWRENLATPEAWTDAARGCPGINNGTHHLLPVIQAALSPSAHSDPSP